MKDTMRYPILVTALAASLLAPTAAHAEEPVQAITPPTVEQPVSGISSPSALDIAITDAGLTRSGGSYSTWDVPFAKLTNGQTFVGDNEYHGYTRTWIPWSGAEVLVHPYSHTVVPSTPATGAAHARGGILTKYLNSGGEERHGRAAGNEYPGTAGKHAGATKTATQVFKTGTGKTTKIVWTSPYGAKVVSGSILAKWENSGGANTYGAPTTDEYAYWADGKWWAQQDFERGTFRWSKETGSILVR